MNRTDRQNFTGRINRGVKWLDKNKPEWLRKMKLKVLDLRNGSVCVLGQAYGDYLKPIWQGLITGDVAWEYGFNLREDGIRCEADSPRKWDLLTQMWADKIKRLRKRRAA